MCAPDPPAAPDPAATAQAQTGTNVSTAIANANLQNVNQVTPNGNLTYSQTGTYDFNDGNQSYSIPRFTATTSLSPAQQLIQDQTDSAKGSLATTAAQQAAFLKDYLAKSGDYANKIQTSYDTDFSSDRQRVEDALFDRLNTKLGADKNSLDATLANQGIKIGSAAYDRAQQGYGQNVNDARTSAILSAGQEQSRLVGLARDAAEFNNTSQAAIRNQPINEISALLNGSQVQQPNFVSTHEPTIPTTDVAGITQQGFQNQMGIYNQEVAQHNALVGGLFGLGAGAIKYSDERLKTDISKVGETDDGQNIYSYRYKAGGPMELGLMAQEVEKKHPSAVKEIGGFKAVDYGKALGLGKHLVKEAA